jgi:hypothetical protein
VLTKSAAAALCTAVLTLACAPAALASGTVTTKVTGKGDVTAPGIDCDESGAPDCKQFYADRIVCEETVPGKPCVKVLRPPVVGFTAAADRDGYQFESWSGCDAVTDRVCSLEVVGNATLEASFADIQGPVLTGLAPPAFARGKLALAASASDNSGAVAKVDFRVGGTLVGTDTTSPYTASTDTTKLNDGPANVTATAFDAAGNRTVLSASTTIDNTAPALSIGAGPDGQTFGPGSRQSWGFAASDAVSGLRSVQCSVVRDGAPDAFGPCTSPTTHSVAGLGDGRYAFSVRARDGAGLQTIATRRFAIDALPPETTIVAGAADGSASAATSRTFRFVSSEPGSSFACRVFPAALTPPAFGSCSGAGTHTASGFAPGAYAFEVRAADRFGNVDAAPARRVFTVTPPGGGSTGPGRPGGGGGGSGGSGGGGSGGGGTRPRRFSPLVRSRFDTLAGVTRFSRLKAFGVPADATVRLGCKGRGCPFKRKLVRHGAGRLNLLPLIARARFRTGSVLQLKLVSVTGARKIVRWAMHADGVADTYRCAPPGGKFKGCGA